MQNQNKPSLTAAERAKLDDLLSELETLLRDKINALSPEERRQKGSIGERNKLFVNKVADFSKSQPKLAAPEIDWEMFANDLETRNYLENALIRFEALTYLLEGAKILFDYDCHQASLDDYAYTNYLAGIGKPGATEKYSALKQFFARQRKKDDSANE